MMSDRVAAGVAAAKDRAFSGAGRGMDLSRYAPGTAAYTAAWVTKQAGFLPEQWRKKALAEYAERLAVSEFCGNAWLRELAQEMRQGAGLPMDAADDELRQAAGDVAAWMYASALEYGSSISGVRAVCEKRCASWGIMPPGPEMSDRGALARMFDSDWWVRKLRAAHGRRVERAAVILGYVSRVAGCYVSDVGLQRRREQKARNRKMLEQTELENQYGDVFTLSELAARATANPRVRRAELMTRISGFELAAARLGHVADFWTITCPSRFHARLSADGSRNPRYAEGVTPRDAQMHLVKAWAKCRAALHRRGVRLYGFRIAEPHHDGCPHWHVLVFTDPACIEQARALVKKYFLDQHDSNEPGAAQQRCRFVRIEPGKGSAVGYVAKYVAKSIDGYALETDLLGNPAVIAAERVEAWASTWGIRQFQQLGGPPVGPWRELRRMTGDEGLTDIAEQARAAANAGAGEWSKGWADYMGLQGGPMVERKNLALAVAYTPDGEKWDAAAEAMVPAENRYGEPCARSVWGVRDVRRDVSWTSRRYKWTTPSKSRAGLGIAAQAAARVAAAAGSVVGVEAVRAATVADRARRGAGRAAVGRATWTRVNNCTGAKNERFGAGGKTSGGGRGAGKGGASTAAGDVPEHRRGATGGRGRCAAGAG